MARTNPPAATSAAHAATDPGPAPEPAAVPDSPAAAVSAALSANPGATVAVIASAAAIGKPAAREALLAMETAGTATRARGGKPGIPDTWTLASPPPGRPGRAEADPGHGQPGDGHGGPGQAEPAGETGQTATGEDTALAGAGDTAGDAPDPAPVPDGSPGQPGTSASPEQGSSEPHGSGPGAGSLPAAAETMPAADRPDPAMVADIAGHIGQIQAAAAAAGTALADGDLHAALAGIAEISDQASQARRALKTAAHGRSARPAARPGGLRENVLGHLRGHPGKDFTPHEIHKVLGNSSGAIANALDTLVKHGHAELATEKPRKFRLAATETTPAHSGGSARIDGRLAGAA